eukprot:6465519-Amphidinium_carterae.1
MFDLAALSHIRQISITVMDCRGAYPLQILQRPGSDWMLLEVNRVNFQYRVVTCMHSCGTTSKEALEDLVDDMDVERCHVTWCYRTQSLIADLLGEQAQIGQNDDDSDSAQSSASRTISSTESFPLSDIRQGGGKRARARPSSSKEEPQDGEKTFSDDADDLLPLIDLAARGSTATSHSVTTPPEEEEQAPAEPMITFGGMFANGRTPYRQVLWPSMTWNDAQVELNRSVKRRRALWCMCVNDTPVDPQARVPLGRTPFDSVEGSLKRLLQPLDYDELRRTNQLCAPTQPTHTGIYSVPIAEEVPELPVHAPLVDACYESSEHSEEEAHTSEHVCSEPASQLDDEHPEVEEVSSITSISSNSDSSDIEIVHIRRGGGRTKRVQQESISNAAIERMIIDLGTTPQGMMVEHRCIARIMHTDARAAKAVFQAQTTEQ